MTHSIQTMTDLWTRHLKTVLAFRGALNEIAAEERKMLHESNQVFKRTRFDAIKTLRERADEICQVLVRMASRQFAPPGGWLNIDEHELNEKFIADFAQRHRSLRDDYSPDREEEKQLAALRAFDPKAVWAWLEMRYGGTKGRELGYAQVAATLIKKFKLVAGSPTKTVSGRVVLGHTVYANSYTKGELHNSEDTAAECLRALATVAHWRDDHLGAASDLRRLADRLRGGEKIQSREKFQVEDCLDIVTYINRFEYRLHPGFARKLQEFISTYGTDMKDAA